MFIRRIGPPRWSSLPEPARLLRDMERLFDAVIVPNRGDGLSGVFPPLNLTRDKENFYVRAEVPGMKASDIQISAEGSKLSIAGKRDSLDKEGASFHRRERPSGSFDRTLALPTDIDTSGVTAHYGDGVLTITLPIAEVSKARQIKVLKA